MSYYQPVKGPANQPVNRETDYQRAERYGRWISVVVLVLGILLVAAIFSSTSGSTVSCDSQNVATAGCAP